MLRPAQGVWVVRAVESCYRSVAPHQAPLGSLVDRLEPGRRFLDDARLAQHDDIACIGRSLSHYRHANRDRRRLDLLAHPLNLRSRFAPAATAASQPYLPPVPGRLDLTRPSPEAPVVKQRLGLGF